MSPIKQFPNFDIERELLYRRKDPTRLTILREKYRAICQKAIAMTDSILYCGQQQLPDAFIEEPWFWLQMIDSQNRNYIKFWNKFNELKIKYDRQMEGG